MAKSIINDDIPATSIVRDYGCYEYSFTHKKFVGGYGYSIAVPLLVLWVDGCVLILILLETCLRSGVEMVTKNRLLNASKIHHLKGLFLNVGHTNDAISNKLCCTVFW